MMLSKIIFSITCLSRAPIEIYSFQDIARNWKFIEQWILTFTAIYFRLKNNFVGNYYFHSIGLDHTDYQCGSSRIILYISWCLNNSSAEGIPLHYPDGVNVVVVVASINCDFSNP